jgi:hypothetical protein
VACRPERGQGGGDESELLDHRVRVLFEEALEEAGRRSRASARVFPRDERCQLERLGQRDPADLARSGLGDEQVVAFERSVKDRPRVPLGSQSVAFPGPDGDRSLAR